MMTDQAVEKALDEAHTEPETDKQRELLARVDKRTEEVIRALKQASSEKLELFCLVAVFDMIEASTTLANIVSKLAEGQEEEVERLTNLRDEFSAYAYLAIGLPEADFNTVLLGALLSARRSLGVYPNAILAAYQRDCKEATNG